MKKLLVLTALVLVGFGTSTATARTNYSNYLTAKRAVCHYFTGYLCGQAMSVVKCETGGTYSPWAENGQYVNIFQMGYHERQLFGWHIRGSSVWLAARAAKNYYNYEVRHGMWGWHPWSCHP